MPIPNVYTATEDPTSQVGNNGDIYFHTGLPDGINVYKKLNGRWGLVGAMSRDGTNGGNATLLLRSSGDSNHPVTNPYTFENSGIIVRDVNGEEVLRLWASDPQPSFSNNATWNLYLGAHAGEDQPTDQTNGGYANTGIGYAALQSVNNISAAQNTALGVQALQSNESGGDNTAIGFEAATSYPITGARNTFIGKSSHSTQETNDNTAIGANTVVSGNENVAIGSDADADGEGDGNIAIGYKANIGFPIVGTFDNRIVIGSNLTGTTNNAAIIGNSDSTDIYFGGTSGLSIMHGKGNAIVFPDSDPHVAGAAYWVLGVLTRSSG